MTSLLPARRSVASVSQYTLRFERVCVRKRARLTHRAASPIGCRSVSCNEKKCTYDDERLPGHFECNISFDFISSFKTDTHRHTGLGPSVSCCPALCDNEPNAIICVIYVCLMLLWLRLASYIANVHHTNPDETTWCMRCDIEY